MMQLFFLALLAATAATAANVVADDLPPSCIKPVYCNSDLLHFVQMARIYNDSKTFVDLHLRQNENTTLTAFQVLLNETNRNPSKAQLESFVNTYFDSSSELEEWTPPDYTTDPKFLIGIRDEKLRQFAKNINAIWPTLGRKVKTDVLEQPDLYSLIPVTNGFIIPGGRFRELYYWDAYWIVEGLLISGMDETVKGMIANLIELLRKIGHIPNGSRWYYQERSQPPLLTAMMSLYIRETNDLEFLRANIDALEDELQYWLDTQIVTFEIKDKAYTLLRYCSPSKGPRPESYYEDFTSAQVFTSDDRQQEFYVDIKSAAESGWDFSSRWFINKRGENSGNLTTVHTCDIVPVDLNSIFTNALQTVAYFRALLHTPHKGAHWGYLAKQWRSTIQEVLWDEEDGIWYDYDILNQQHRKYFYPSNVAPLWMGAVEKNLIKNQAPRILAYLRNSQGLSLPGGVPTSLIRSGEQWDFPNAWPPLVSIVVNSLEALNSEEAKNLAYHVAETWVRSCYKGFVENKQMFEKYDAEVPGRVGGGGEYTVQEGFGWSNGVVLEFIAKYGRKLTATEDSKSPVEVIKSVELTESTSLLFESESVSLAGSESDEAFVVIPLARSRVSRSYGKI